MNTAPDNFVQCLEASGLGGDWEWQHQRLPDASEYVDLHEELGYGRRMVDGRVRRVQLA